MKCRTSITTTYYNYLNPNHTTTSATTTTKNADAKAKRAKCMYVRTKENPAGQAKDAHTKFPEASEKDAA